MQTTTGIRSVLSHPIFYDATQRLLGARRGQSRFVRHYVRPSKTDTILDIGCGTASLLEFIPLGTSYVGYDLNENYIEAARRRFGTRGSFRVGAVNEIELESLPQFDIVIASGILHHLNDDETRQFFQLAQDTLKAGGRLITIDPCYEHGQNPIARWLIRMDRGRNVREASAYLALAHEVFADTTRTVEHRRWIPYTHCLMECRRKKP